MAVTSNALLRHITIDACLRDAAHKYTLQDLIAACTRAIKENSKEKLKDNFTVSTRTVQLDLQFMRDRKKGYNAPIVVYEQKYYRYKEPNYSIGNANVKQTNLAPLSEIAETLRRYTKISGMESLTGAMDIIRDVIDNKVNGSSKNIRYPKYPKISGGQFADVVKDAVVHRKVLSLSHINEKTGNTQQIIFYPLYMKVWKDRWYALGYEEGRKGIHVIAIDTINSYSYAILPFPGNYTFNAEEYFSDIIGVTKPEDDKVEITFSARQSLAGLLNINPVHKSQKLIQKDEHGTCTYRITVIPNDELYRFVYESQPDLTIISPRDVGIKANGYITDIAKNIPSYVIEKPKKEVKKKKPAHVEPDLFGGLI